MSGMTYNSLVSQIESYLNNTSADVIAQIPYFIYQAQQRISRESKDIGLESYVVSTFTPGSGVLQKPAGWRRNLSLNYGTGTGDNTRTQLFLRSIEFCNAYWPDRTQTKPPLYYSDYGYSNILVVPSPDQAYPFEWCYLQLPPPITPANQTNWITDFAPDVLLYACLLEAIPYLKDDERIAVWGSLYEKGIKSLNDQDDMRTTDRASERSSD